MTTIHHESSAQPTPALTPDVAPEAGLDAGSEDGVATIASYPRYRDAEAAVDLLSDAGFAVGGVAIVGRDVRTVEVVTGRLTKGRAALNGLAGGAWAGLFIGLLLGIFVPGIAWFGVIVTALVLGAVWGTVFGFLGHAMTGGRRDFDSLQSLQAGHYDVTVDAARAEVARRLLTAEVRTA